MIKKWIEQNTESLKGKCVAVTGATGGLGAELCKYLCFLGADLVLLDRNREKSLDLKETLLQNSSVNIENITVDLEDIESVKSACNELETRKIDFFIHNAGAYSIPRKKCSTGFDNVFQINFVSPYYIINRLLPQFENNNSRVIVVGSIAHNYCKTRRNDVDFSMCDSAALVYGNAKRYLMFSLYELLSTNQSVTFSVVHPGITLTGITAHYPKWLFAIIKRPMKIIFMSPKRAALSLLKGFFVKCGYKEWIGPKIFDIWGAPKKRQLKTCSDSEIIYIHKTATEIYNQIKSDIKI